MSATHAHSTRRSDRWIALARAAWLLIVLVALGRFVVSVPFRYAELRQPCIGLVDVCSERGLLTPDRLQQLEAAGLTADFYAAEQVAISVLGAIPWVLIGLAIFILGPKDRMALLVSVALVLLGTNDGLATAASQVWPILAPLNRIHPILTWASFGLFTSLFPTGRFVPRWSPWAVAAWVLLISVPGGLADLAALRWLVGALWLAFWAFCLGAQLYRYRSVSEQVDRQKTKWVMYGVTVGLGGILALIIVYLLDPAWPDASLAARVVADVAPSALMGFIPLSIGVAILRSRLFDIDVVIRKTLVYSALSGVLALVYLGGVVLLQQILRGVTGPSPDLAIVVSTLAIAVLFTPLRRTVQSLIDRRFYRRKYDAAKTLAAFGETARDETDLDRLAGRLVEVAQGTMQPEHASLWLRPPGRDRGVRATGDGLFRNGRRNDPGTP